MVLLLLVLSGAGQCDDGFFMGAGSSVMPINSTKVKMLSEKVALKVKKIGKEKQIFVTCDFAFISPEKEKILMGFPDVEDERRAGWGGGIKNFKVFLNGKQIDYKVKPMKPNVDLPDLRYKKIFTWNVLFPKNRIVRIRHTYDMAVSEYLNSGVYGAQYSVEYVPYILKTGSLWAGKIGKAEITIQLDKDYPIDDLKVSPAGSLYRNRTISWTFKNLKPAEDIRVEIHDPRRLLVSDDYLTDLVEKDYFKGRPDEYQIKLDKLNELKKEIRSKYGVKYPDIVKQNLKMIDAYEKNLSAIQKKK